ncbi:methylated-DNA--[protein]-cysteine S-methyltransferase [Demequina sp.]|uniref:methylated-DNA--[protein]-cysteine S-methyltransferase n=1 Tax=Demequina sp. TaxID=2050685 RepID=UPI003A8C6B61
MLSTGLATPLGVLTVVADDDGTVLAAGFRPLGEVVAQLSMADAGGHLEPGHLSHVAAAVEAWVGGAPAALSEVPVRLSGGPFTTHVWETLRTVPAGEVVSYGELAQMAGSPRAMRAVGTACARNAIALFVPCHRVIAAGGRLGSYGFGGPGIKAALLEHEGMRLSAGPVSEATRVGGPVDSASTW